MGRIPPAPQLSRPDFLAAWKKFGTMLIVGALLRSAVIYGYPLVLDVCVEVDRIYPDCIHQSLTKGVDAMQRTSLPTG
jgi:hypothetical protein